jgi:transcriptional antiterminator
LNPGHWETAETQLRLGQLLVLKGEDQDARDLLEQSEQTLSEYFGEDHVLVQDARKELTPGPPVQSKKE